MCSSPKGSTTRRRHGKKTEFSRVEYEEYALMVRRASICYEKAQQRKAERRQQIASQQTVSINKPRDISKGSGGKYPNILSNIKGFFMQTVTLKRVWR